MPRSSRVDSPNDSTWNGEPDAAIEQFAHAMRLSPLDPELYRMQAGLAAAHLFAGRFDAASSCAEKAFRELPSFLMVVSKPCARGPAGRGAARRAIDNRIAAKLLSRLKSGSKLLADRGYDADWIRTLVRQHGAWGEYPSKEQSERRA